MLKKVFGIILKIIAILIVSIMVLFFIIYYWMTYNVEWLYYVYRGPVWKSDGVELIVNLNPIEETVRISLPYRTIVRKNPYELDIRIRIDNQDIKSITFQDIARILPDGREIDFWLENITGFNEFGWNRNPYVYHNGYYDTDEIINLRENRKIELSFDSILTTDRYTHIWDSIHIIFTPVDINFRTIDSFVLKFEIYLEYISGEIVMKEIEYNFIKEIYFKKWNELEWD
jgi:hypothetical protein